MDNRPIENNFDLLNKMMEDMRSAPVLYKPTNYWQMYESGSIKYLKRHGLRNFRSYNSSRLASFGAGTYRDIPMNQRYKDLVDFKGAFKSPLMTTIFEVYSRILTHLGRKYDLFNLKKYFVNEAYFLQDFRELQNLQYRFSKLMDSFSGLNRLDHIEDSGAGDPYDLFLINGRHYTGMFLEYFNQLCHIKRHIDFSRINSVIEIGGGYGGSAEVFIKAFPHIRYFDFDIPPQIYVSQQYLSSVFSGQVYGYENFISKEKFDLEKYRIFCLPTWALESISGIKFDLFINSASFQEMERDVVENYYSLIKDKASYAYLFELTHGSYRKTSEYSGGCVEPLKIDDIASIFKDFEILARSEYYRITHPHMHLILKNKKKA